MRALILLLFLAACQGYYMEAAPEQPEFDEPAVQDVENEMNDSIATENDSLVDAENASVVENDLAEDNSLDVENDSMDRATLGSIDIEENVPCAGTVCEQRTRFACTQSGEPDEQGPMICTCQDDCSLKKEINPDVVCMEVGRCNGRVRGSEELCGQRRNKPDGFEWRNLCVCDENCDYHVFCNLDNPCKGHKPGYEFTCLHGEGAWKVDDPDGVHTCTCDEYCSISVRCGAGTECEDLPFGSWRCTADSTDFDMNGDYMCNCDNQRCELDRKYDPLN